MNEKTCEKCSMRVVDHTITFEGQKINIYKCQIKKDMKKGTCKRCLPWSEIL